MNPNKPDIHDCPYNNPAEQARLRNLVDSMNALIRHHRSLAGAESREDFVKGLQKLFFRSGLPADVRSQLQPFYLTAQLKAAQQDEWFDAQAMDDAFQEAMQACLEPDVCEKLKDLAARTRVLIEQRLGSAAGLSSEQRLKKDLLAINKVNPVHWRVRNFFRKKIRENIPKKPFDFGAVLQELKSDWKARENTGEIKAAERRREADRTLNSIRADIQMERHIREVLRAPVSSEKKVDVARAAEQALLHREEPLPETKPQLDFPGDRVEVGSETAAPPVTETAFPPLTGMPLEEFGPLMEENAPEEAEAPKVKQPGTPDIPETKKDLLSRQFPKIIGPEKHQWNGLMMATFSGNENSVRRFLKQGIDVNEADETGYTPLMLAAENDFDHIVEILIEYNADSSLKDKKNETALDKARKMGYVKIIALLESIEFKVRSTRKKIDFPDYEVAEKAVKMKEAETAQQAFEWGNDASRGGDYDLARRYFEQAITIDPDFTLAYKHLGYVLEQLGELKLSADYHRTATEMESRSLIKSARQAVQMGDNFNNQNDFEKALECYEKVFTYGFDPTPDVVVMAYFGIGQIYLKRNDLEPAKEHFKKILKIDPGHFNACRYLGYIFHREGDLLAAKVWYNKALENQPDNEWVKEHLRAIRTQEAPSVSSGYTLEEAFADLAAQQKQKEADFQAQMGNSVIQAPEDMLTDGSGDEAESFHTPTTDELNGIGFPVETDGMPPPPLPPDAVSIGKGAFDFIPPAVRGQSKLGEEALEQKRLRAKKRLEELCRVIACEEHRTAEELDEAVKGYVALVKQPKLSCIEGVDHRTIAIKLRDLWKQGLLEDFGFTPVEMAHAQDLAVSNKVSGIKSEEYFKALAEFGKSYFEMKTIEAMKKAGFFFFKALEIDPKPKGEYKWVKGYLNEAKKWLERLEKEAEEQPVQIEEDFENSLRPPTIINADMPEAVRQEAQEGMGIFSSKTRKFIPGPTKVVKEPVTIPQGRSLRQRLKEQLGDVSDEPVTQRNIQIPEEVSRSEADEFDLMPPTMPVPHILDEVLKDIQEDNEGGPEVADNPEFRRKAQEFRHQYIESNDPAHKKMLQTTIYKYHYDDINFHRRKNAMSYLELGISLITFKDKPRATRALNEALKLVQKDQVTLKDQINEWLGKLNEKAV
ncbi:tetratricopeptide repeat protein [Candidatus Peregrinibacteria bacterium]|nr:tetratricopeptide repeat protein [Candidatus Peregrinibacteria bacterium]